MGSRVSLVGDVISRAETLLSWGLHHWCIHIQVIELACFFSVMDSGPCYLSHILLLILSVDFLQVAEYLTKKERYFTLINPYFLNEKLLENVIVTHSLKYHHNLLLMQIYEILDVNNHMSVISQKMSHYGLQRSKFGFLQPVPLAAKAFRLLLMFESPSSFRNA